MADQAKGESAKAFQLQLKPHLREIAKKVITKEEQNEQKEQKNITNQQNQAATPITIVSTATTTDQNNSQFNPLDVIKSLAEMKPIVIVKKDSATQSKSRSNSYSNQRAISSKVQATNGFQVDQSIVSKSEQVLEEEALSLIEKHSQIGFQSLCKDDLKSALLNLRRSDIIMNAFIANEGQIDMSILYFVKVNLGICFYKIGLLEEAFTCFETCIMSIKKQQRDSNVNAILVKLYFQCCILQSELSNHERALFFGKKATKTIISQYMDLLIGLAQKLANYQRSIQAMDAIQSQKQLSVQRNINKKSDKSMIENDYYGAQYISQNKKQSSKQSVASSIDQQQNSFYNLSNMNLNMQNISEFDYQGEDSQPNNQNQTSNGIDIEMQSIQINPKNNQQYKGNNFRNNKKKLLEIQTSVNQESFYMSSQMNETQSEISKDVKGLLQQNASETNSIISEFETNLRKIQVNTDLTDQEKNFFMIIKSILSKVLDIPSLLSAKKYSILSALFKNHLKSTIDATQSPMLEKGKESKTSSPKISQPGNHFRSTFLEKMNMKEIFKNQEVVLQKSNILGQLQLKAMSLEQIRAPIPNEINEKILLFNAQLSVGFYCVSTEYRFIEQPQANLTKENCDEVTNSENYLSRALEIAFVYLPHEVPLVGQIMSVHTKFHAAFRQCIYEDQPDQKNHTLVRTLPGGCKAPFFIPLIRKKREQFQITNSKILNTDLIKQHQDFSKQERLHLDAHPTEEYQNETESDQGFFIQDEAPNSQNYLLQQNLATIIHKGNEIQIQQQKANQRKNSIQREKSAEGTSRKNKKSSEQAEKIYRSNKMISGNPQGISNQTGEIKVRQNRTLDPPSKARSISSNNGPATIHSSFISNSQNPSPQSGNNQFIGFQTINKQQKSIDKQSIDINSQRNLEYNNGQFQHNIQPNSSQQKTNNNYINRLKILTKPPLHQRIQQAINSQQQTHQTSSSLQASQIQLSSQEKQIEKEIFQLQVKYQQAKNNQISTNNFISQNDETLKYKIQNHQQGNYSIQQTTSQQLNSQSNFIQNSSANISQANNNSNTPILASNQNNFNQIIQQNQNQSQALNPIQKRKKNFNIQINNNINFFIQNGTNSNNSSLNNSFHSSNQLPESSNENIPSKSFNSTPLGTNRQQYSRQNKHTNKSQNSNQNTTNPNLSALLQQENIIFNQERSNSLNYPNVQKKRSKHYYQKNQNHNTLNYNSAQNSPNTSFQILNTSTPQNSSTLFPLSSKNKNTPQGQAIFNSTHNNQQNIINSNQIQIQNSIPQTTKAKPSPQLKDIIFATGNQSVKNQAQQETPINFGLPSSTKNPYINNKNLRKFKLASEIINF
ncbi:hypothetical protein TTHERM_00277110 (macronuclear) [Tetrahymena thermophila SB210]|uniref:Tetratricopeptide repeat protein n=1 Tax=Tetrahymena thermophila (strain SB210) TaxID=312017 RepID=I7MEU6_TETTS|nr:hypothetical protein TTHERM_00277110 [Tetrahymena thermophila SB210]EAR97826.2 hypothetical protein TTHERM_00277110 [Tetrahymena thermophila SB210]|eukprot:XP_001018071.2 hypothetical protein TTHERM_00277110 [Tetrahymena thermophila SB210]